MIPSDSDKAKKASRLDKVEVFHTDTIVIKWTVNQGDRSIEVEDKESGQTALNSSGEGLQLYMTEDDFGDAPAPYDFIVQLLEFCDISEGRATLLSYILMEKKSRRIERYLIKEGIEFEAGSTGEDVDGSNTRYHSVSYSEANKEIRELERDRCKPK